MTVGYENRAKGYRMMKMIWRDNILRRIGWGMGTGCKCTMYSIHYTIYIIHCIVYDKDVCTLCNIYIVYVGIYKVNP